MSEEKPIILPRKLGATISIDGPDPQYHSHAQKDHATHFVQTGESTEEKQIEYLRSVVRLQNEKHEEETRILRAEIKELKAFNGHLVREKENMILRILEATGVRKL